MNIIEILAEIQRKYNAKPLGWRVFVGRDEAGFPTVVFISPDKELWELKFDSLYKPNPLAIGSKITDTEVKSNTTFKHLPYYGFRPIPKDKLKKLLILPEDSLKEMIRDILSTSPVPTSSIRGFTMQGPILVLKNLPQLSEKQTELDLKLRRDLQMLLRRSGISDLYT